MEEISLINYFLVFGITHLIVNVIYYLLKNKYWIFSFFPLFAVILYFIHGINIYLVMTLTIFLLVFIENHFLKNIRIINKIFASIIIYFLFINRSIYFLFFLLLIDYLMEYFTILILYLIKKRRLYAKNRENS
ncbi:MAG TPA: hypothetical protein VKN74_04550 [Candidatus Mcinerneyibacterium sp.]|nr:hypothetical protein [Candidatus Mcinerneyibacterium sp.]